MPSPSRLLKDIGGVTPAADVTRCRYDDFGRAASLVPILAKPLGVARIDAG